MSAILEMFEIGCSSIQNFLGLCDGVDLETAATLAAALVIGGLISKFNH